MSFKEVHEFFENVIAEVDKEGKADIAALEAELRTVGADAKNAFNTQAQEILKQLQAAQPQIQDAVKSAVDALAQALLQAFAAHGL
jgi:hypothetical protein